jgi:hypothetical protein
MRCLWTALDLIRERALAVAAATPASHSAAAAVAVAVAAAAAATAAAAAAAAVLVTVEARADSPQQRIMHHRVVETAVDTGLLYSAKYHSMEHAPVLSR